MKQEVLKIIHEIQQNKQSQSKFPDYALKIEVLNKMRERLYTTLTELTNDGKLISGTTINDSYYHLP